MEVTQIKLLSGKANFDAEYYRECSETELNNTSMFQKLDIEQHNHFHELNSILNEKHEIVKAKHYDFAPRLRDEEKKLKDMIVNSYPPFKFMITRVIGSTRYFLLLE